MFYFLFLLFSSLFAVDYDCVVVGSSPFSLLEAVYRSRLGNRVLILEGASECGGSWKSINACGISHVDLGCHQIGHDKGIKDFLETYLGCTIASLDNPLMPYSDPSTSPNGFYFSKGCSELVDNIISILKETDVDLRLNHRLESVVIDPSHEFATVKVQDQEFTTSKLVVTNMTSFEIESTRTVSSKQFRKAKYYHLYLLIQDPTPPKFCYHHGISNGMSRLMNLTHFVGLANTGQHLIVIQVHSDEWLGSQETFLADMKTKKLIDPSAYILRSETNIYEQDNLHSAIHRLSPLDQKLFETINTGHFQSMSIYIPKWREVLIPFRDRMARMIGNLPAAASFFDERTRSAE